MPSFKSFTNFLYTFPPVLSDRAALFPATCDLACSAAARDAIFKLLAVANALLPPSANTGSICFAKVLATNTAAPANANIFFDSISIKAVTPALFIKLKSFSDKSAKAPASLSKGLVFTAFAIPPNFCSP